MKRYTMDSGAYCPEEAEDGEWVKYEDYAFMECAADYEANYADELMVVVDAARKLVKAKGRYHTELSYAELAEALKGMEP